MRLSHAHTTLLIGQVRAGRALALEEIARQWCREQDAPCGHCPICNRVFCEQHPDVHILDREGAPIRIDDMRAFIGEEHVRPYEAPFKAYIIVHAEMMNAPCQNSLLKTLEEPDGDTRFYLIAEKTDSFLPTILSRCAIRRIVPEKTDELTRRLQEDGATAFCAQMAAMLSNGSLMRAKELIEDRSFFENGRHAADALCTAVSSGAFSPLYVFVSKKEDAIIAFTWWRALLRDIVLIKTNADAPRYYSEKPKDFDACAARLGARGAMNLIAALDRAQMQIEGNVSAPLAADGFLLAAMKENQL